MTLEFYITWLAVIFPLVYSPGPGNILCAISGASAGVRGSAPFILGLNFSYTAYSILAGFGLGALTTQYPQIFYYVQVLGCLYIVYLAISFFRRKQTTNATPPKLTFRNGAVSQALNVKGVSIVVLMYSQFLRPDEVLHWQVAQLVLMLLTLNLFTHFTWAAGGSWMISKLASARAAKIQNRIYGVMLFGVALWMWP